MSSALSTAKLGSQARPFNLCQTVSIQCTVLAEMFFFLILIWYTMVIYLCVIVEAIKSVSIKINQIIFKFRMINFFNKQLCKKQGDPDPDTKQRSLTWRMTLLGNES